MNSTLQYPEKIETINDIHAFKFDNKKIKKIWRLLSTYKCSLSIYLCVITCEVYQWGFQYRIHMYSFFSLSFIKLICYNIRTCICRFCFTTVLLRTTTRYTAPSSVLVRPTGASATTATTPNVTWLLPQSRVQVPSVRRSTCVPKTGGNETPWILMMS